MKLPDIRSSIQALSGFLRRVVNYLIRLLGSVTQHEFRQVEHRIDETQRQLDIAHRQLDAVHRRFDAAHRQLDAVHRRLDAAHRQLDAISRHIQRHSESVVWLARTLENPALPDRNKPVPLDHGPLVSVIMPVYNREYIIARAIDSVRDQAYAHWELLIVDDGSSDGTRTVLERYADDDRIRVLDHPHGGACRARNMALEHSRGEIIAYLDSDNIWFPGYLAQVVDALNRRPECECVYLGQIFHDRDTNQHWIQGLEFDREKFIREGGIDLNTFAHRRSVYEREGGFDTELSRLSDWELIGRYTRLADPMHVRRISGLYHVAEPDSISCRENFAYNAWLVQKKLVEPLSSPPKVLYLAGNYPQLSETYIRSEIACMQRWGVEIEVWSEDPVPGAAYTPDVPVHTGTLEQALDSFQPHHVHAHFLHLAQKHSNVVAARGLTLTVRGHSFEYSRELLEALEHDETISGIYCFPHQVEGIKSEKIFPLPVIFNGDWYPPSSHKDHKLVLRCAAALPTRGLDDYFAIAKSCPDHKFLLALATIKGQETLLQKLDEHNRSIGNPVEIRHDVPHEEMHELTAAAGIYLHTYDPRYPYGMPISIAESMATGAFIIARHCIPALDYIGDAGAFYDNVQKAADIVLATATWSEDEWQMRQQRSTERAYMNYSDIKNLRPMLEHWRRLVRKQ